MNETNLHRVARRLSRLTGLTYQQARTAVTGEKPRPNLDDPAVIDRLVAAGRGIGNTLAPAAPGIVNLSELVADVARIVNGLDLVGLDYRTVYGGYTATFRIGGTTRTFVHLPDWGGSDAVVIGDRDENPAWTPDDAGISEDDWVIYTSAREELADLGVEYGRRALVAAVDEYLARRPVTAPVAVGVVDADVACVVCQRIIGDDTEPGHLPGICRDCE